MNKQMSLGKLRRLRQHCAMEDFCAKDDATTRLVKEETRVYRETWVLPIVDELIRDLEAKIAKARIARQKQMQKYRFGGR